ncbi:MAG: DUF3617 family protein [Alphaproteobacteria bacterium]|jgi:hypothetical protein|nr:DUF3617 family protein [Alphaproteobacteria bacterium]
MTTRLPMTTQFIAALMISALAACAPPAQQAEQSPQDAAREAAQAAARLEAGLWRTTITMTEMSIPGAPPEMMEAMMGAPVTVEECRTSDDPATATEAWTQTDGTCEPGRFEMAGSRFEGERTCSQQGMAMTVRFSGTITPTRMEGQTEMTGQSPMGAMTQRATILSERVGECPG